MFKSKAKMPKTLHGAMDKKGAADPANFGKKESSPKVKSVVNKGAKAPTQFMKVAKKGM
jgi:hypothetical protein